MLTKRNGSVRRIERACLANLVHEILEVGERERRTLGADAFGQHRGPGAVGNAAECRRAENEGWHAADIPERRTSRPNMRKLWHQMRASRTIIPVPTDRIADAIPRLDLETATPAECAMD